MKKRVLIHMVEVFERGQKISFQINLPKDAEKIISVYQSVIPRTDGDEFIPKSKEGNFFERTVVMGDLRLQSFDKAGWFYTGEVNTQDRNLMWGDSAIITAIFFPSPATHAIQNFKPVTVLANAQSSTIIHGYYTDRVGILEDKRIEYKVKIYIEVELKICKA